MHWCLTSISIRAPNGCKGSNSQQETNQATGRDEVIVILQIPGRKNACSPDRPAQIPESLGSHSADSTLTDRFCYVSEQQCDNEANVVNLGQPTSIISLSHLTDPMLEKLSQVTQVVEYGADAYILKEGDDARYLRAIVDGKIGLELEKTTGNIVMIDKISRGRTFGFFALVDTEQEKCTTHARSITDTKLFAWEGTELEMQF